MAIKKFNFPNTKDYAPTEENLREIAAEIKAELEMNGYSCDTEPDELRILKFEDNKTVEWHAEFAANIYTLGTIPELPNFVVVNLDVYWYKDSDPDSSPTRIHYWFATPHTFPVD